MNKSIYENRTDMGTVLYRIITLEHPKPSIAINAYEIIKKTPQSFRIKNLDPEKNISFLVKHGDMINNFYTYNGMLDEVEVIRESLITELINMNNIRDRS